jgi:hypothetical protein
MVAVAAVAAPGVARADDRQLARDEFAAGQDADRRKDYATAIQHYLRAYELAPHPNALYNAAVDYERLGQLRDAATFYGRYLDDAGDSDDRTKVTRLIEGLRKRPSKVSIRTTPPGGQITIDGAHAGQAPLVMELPGGTHTIAATLGDRLSQRQLAVEFGEPREVVIALSEQQGMLSVTSNVPSALVEVDGVQVGVTPLTIAVPAGDRKVIVRSAGYSTVERQVRVPAEGSAQITASLVHPTGYVEPTVPMTRTYVVAFGLSSALRTDATSVGFVVGYRVQAWEAGARFAAYGEGRVGYGLQLRRYVGTGRIKPYLGVRGDYFTSASAVTGIVDSHAGVAIDLFAFPRLVAELAVDGGVGMLFADGERQLVFPIGVAIQLRGR